MVLTATPSTLVGWTPIRLRWDATPPMVDWCFTDGVPFTDPFFDQTIERCFRDPCRLLFRRETGMEDVGRFVAAHPGLPPTAFIFHMSRCGSTLLCQMLAALSGNVVLSEAGPIDTVLRGAGEEPGVSGDERVRWLRWIVGALGQGRRPGQHRLYVKLDAWSAFDLPVVRAAFPDVPWLFLYRDPVEVLVSHSRRLGAHLIPGVLRPALVGMTPDEVQACPPVVYQARVLAGICRAALEHQDDPLGTFVEYGQLPGFAASELARITGADLSPADVECMLAAARRDAKNPALAFEDDRAVKRGSASAALRAAAERWLSPVYEALEDARRRQRGRQPVPRGL